MKCHPLPCSRSQSNIDTCSAVLVFIEHELGCQIFLVETYQNIPNDQKNIPPSHQDNNIHICLASVIAGKSVLMKLIFGKVSFDEISQ
jgi:hypothetical protein